MTTMSDLELGIAIGQHRPVGDIVIGEPPLLTIHPDGSVDGRVADAGEAGRALVDWLQGHLAGMIRDAKAEAWDEGFGAGMKYATDLDNESSGQTDRAERPANPYLSAAGRSDQRASERGWTDGAELLTRALEAGADAYMRHSGYQSPDEDYVTIDGTYDATVVLNFIRAAARDEPQSPTRG
jgi:hypothetical protein